MHQLMQKSKPPGLEAGRPSHVRKSPTCRSVSCRSDKVGLRRGGPRRVLIGAMPVDDEWGGSAGSMNDRCRKRWLPAACRFSGVDFPAFQVSKDSFETARLFRITGNDHGESLQFGRT